MSYPDMALRDFLKSRGLSDETIFHFEDEKIDCTTLLQMSEEEIKKLIPKYGDRIAISSFCKKKINSNKHSLIEKLKSKIDDTTGRKRRKIGSDGEHRSSKKTRIIEIGWLCTSSKSKEYRQVRAKCGGGTRRIPVEKKMKCAEIMRIAKDLFFPSGKSTKGDVGMFHFELLDFKIHKFDVELTVQDMYELSSMSTLRFYLATCLKEGMSIPTEDDTDYIPSTVVRDSINTNEGRSNVQSNTENNFVIMSESEVHGNGIESYETSFFSENVVYQNHQELNFPLDGNLEFIYDESPVTRTMTLHRGNIFQDLVEAFKQPFFDDGCIKIEMILPNGHTEYAEDFGGVFRDALSEFWSTFYEQHTLGTDLKIPYLRHDVDDAQLKAIGKVLLKGYECEKYLPIRLAPVFLYTCFGYSVDEEELVDNFLHFLCDTEADLVRDCLADFDNANKEDLEEFLSQFDTKYLPVKENIKQLVIEIAYQQLVRKPGHFIRCFEQVLKLQNIRLEESEIKNAYSMIKPSVKNCLSKIALQNEKVSVTEKNIFAFLKKFLKEVDEKTRMNFFRFATGSDLPIKDISVSFIDSSGISRVPVAHTCSGLLELPTSYENYVDFRSELTNLLNSNIWVMDLI